MRLFFSTKKSHSKTELEIWKMLKILPIFYDLRKIETNFNIVQ